MTALERGLAECGARGRDVAAVVHATTVATNAIIEGKIARVGMLVTRGFRDILEIGRQIRSAPLRRASPEAGAAGAPALEPRGRASGSTPRARCWSRSTSPRCAAVRRLRAREVEAVVICFLHSYLNPAHERAAAAIVREEMPGDLAVRLVGGVPGVPRVPAREHRRGERGGACRSCRATWTRSSPGSPPSAPPRPST